MHRGVRQGDVISPKLYTAALEDSFKLLEWQGLGIKINGEYITHFRFADDIVFMKQSMEDLRTMLEGLNGVSQQVGHPVSVGNSTLEVVDEYVYLEQTVPLGRSDFEKEVTR